MSEQSVKLNMLILLAFLLLSYGAGNIHCSTVHGNSTDMLSLLDFKTATQDPTGALRSWNRSIHYCNWKGVTCSPTDPGRVTALQLGGERLAGQITPSIGNLTFLQILNLSSNGFSGQLPPLHRLNMLELLDLNSNGFSGQIPSLAQLQQLQTLYLNSNGFSGQIPSVSQLLQLEVLDLSSNGFSGQIPSLSQLLQLEALVLSSNGFSGQIPSLSQLQELVFLDLHSNSLQGIIPDSVTDCLNLKFLDLSENKLEGQIPAKIGSLHNLSYLGLSRNNLNGNIPPTLGNATNLQILFIEENQLGGRIPDELGQLSNMASLSLSDNNLSGRIPLSIFNLTSLQILGLHTNKLEMALPLDIGDTLRGLTNLTLGNNILKGNIPASLGNVSGLLLLDLSSNSLVGEIPSFGNLPSLVYLNLGNNKLQSSDKESWESLYGLTNCSSLKMLALDNNQLQGTIPNSIGKFSTELTSLYLGGNNLSGIVPSSLGNLGSLIDLDLSKNNFTGTIDEWVGSLKKIQSLDLHRNNFVGSIPPSFGNLTRLTLLSLAENEFDGPIPPILGTLSLLIKMDLSYNNLQGNIPQEIGGLRQLIVLNISSNRLTGEIPDNLSQCEGLVTIQLDYNNLTGNIPTLDDLTSLNMLSLSHNDLSGTIPVSLNGLELLSKLDLSYNQLQGPIPKIGVFGNASAVSLDGNPGLCGGVPELHMAPCAVASRRTEIRYYLVRVLIPLFGFMSLVLLVYFVLLERKMSRTRYESQAPLGEHFPKVSYNDLVEATRNFSESNQLGKGSYGTVYKGKLVLNKMEVAVKVFDLEMRGAERSFMSECEALRTVQHRNLLSIITACSTVDSNGNPFRALIYEFMPKGNLDTWLHQKGDGEAHKPLSFNQRINIAVNIGDALDYLHNDSENPIIHCDLKPSNILLDDDMVAHLGDFGIARFFIDSKPRPADSTTSIGVKGTIGYIPPEYAGGGHISTSGDVYSFGIVLLEMFTGRRPTDPIFKDGLDIVNFVGSKFPHQIHDAIDAHLNEECKEFAEARTVPEDPVYQCLVSLLQVALSCTRQFPNERANMRETASKVQAIKASYLGRTAKKNSSV